MTWPYAAGAIASTVNDLAKWNAALDARRLLKSSSFQAMWTPVRLNDGKTAPYGFGWTVDKIKEHARISHSGGIPGFTSHIGRFPDDGLTVIVLCNQGVDTERIANAVAGFYIPELAPPTYKPIADREPQVTERVKTVVRQAAQGTVDSGQFTPELAATMLADLKRGGSAGMLALGALQSIVLLERRDEGSNRVYRYRLVYKDSTLATVVTIDKNDKISGMTLHSD